MEKLKKLIRYPFSLMGIQVFTTEGYNTQQKKVDDIILIANKFYIDSLSSRFESLTDPEYLQFLELKYGGYVRDVSATINSHDVSRILEGNCTGGDRMNVFFHNYSEKYSQYLKPLRHSKNVINILEVGILKGTGLAVWDEYFDKKQIYGFYYDLGNFEQNRGKYIELGAFQNGFPTPKFFDQFVDNSETLIETFEKKELDVVIDDAYHSDESIINTFNELQPYLNEEFIYFIEDNGNAYKKLKIKYPQYNFDYNGNQLTVVTKN